MYETAYADSDSCLTPERLRQAVADLEDMFRWRRHLAAVEMPLDELAGKRVLEVGSGAGGHSALFASKQALVTSVDLTFQRARATNQKLQALRRDGRCQAMQADAETLPFADASFDIVYSNGVLHHTNDTARAIDEVFRVLKPGGIAVIMLYCKSSFHYWAIMVPLVGLLQGKLFQSANWLGHATEWMGSKRQTAVNPITRCYSHGGIRRLFAKFADVSLRKTDFYFYLIPKIGRLYRRYQIRRYGVHPGGLLVYGEPWPRPSPLELWLGTKMGFSWNIRATKRAA